MLQRWVILANALKWNGGGGDDGRQGDGEGKERKKGMEAEEKGKDNKNQLR